MKILRHNSWERQGFTVQQDMDNVFSLVAGIMDDLKCFYLLHEDASPVQREISITFEGCLAGEPYRLSFVTPFLNNADRRADLFVRRWGFDLMTSGRCFQQMSLCSVHTAKSDLSAGACCQEPESGETGERERESGEGETEEEEKGE